MYKGQHGWICKPLCHRFKAVLVEETLGFLEAFVTDIVRIVRATKPFIIVKLCKSIKIKDSRLWHSRSVEAQAGSGVVD